MNRPFLSIHNHTRVGSVRDCLADIHEMCDKAHQNGFGWTVTDHGTIASWVQYAEACEKHGIKPAYGCELYTNPQLSRLFQIREQLEKLKVVKNPSDQVKDTIRRLSIEFEQVRRYRHLIAIATTTHGFYNLIDLHNRAYSDGFYGKPMATYRWLFDLPKDKNGDRGLVVTSACLASESSRAIMEGKLDAAEDWIGLMHEEMPGRFFVELQPNGMELQREVNSAHINIARKLKVPLSIGTDAHYVGSNYSKLHDAFLLIQSHGKISDIGKKVWRISYEAANGSIQVKKLAPGDKFRDIPVETLTVGQVLNPDSKKERAVIRSIEEVDKVWTMESELDLTFKDEQMIRLAVAQDHPEMQPVLEEAIESNKRIYELIDDHIDIDTDIKLPRLAEARQKLYDRCHEGLRRIGRENDETYLKRLEYEFSVVDSGVALDSYFLLLAEIVEFARANKIPVGPGRGSGPSALMAYLLGITRLDPIQLNFPYERFLTPERVARWPVVRFETEDGCKHEYREHDRLVVLRNGNKITVAASELLPEDDFLEAHDGPGA